jgi:MFS family permease
LGLVIGALFTQLVSWRWVFFFNAIVSLPTAIICSVLVPNVLEQPRTEDVESHGRWRVKETLKKQFRQLKEIDIPGITMLTVSVILFIFAVTSGSTTKWGSAQVLVPLIASIVLVTIFFFYEARIPFYSAAL